MMQMIDVDATKIEQWAAETRQAAAEFHHEWDRLAVEWDGVLHKHSIVIECGSFKGRWALQIARRYRPYLYCFEPQEWAAATTKTVLDRERLDCMVLPFGLWSKDEALPFFNQGTDGCTGGEMREIGRALGNLGIESIDLMLINIEGGEYTLIPHMFKQNIFPQRLMVQFHEGEYDNLRELIEQHYTILWDYGRTLAAFELKREK